MRKAGQLFGYRLETLADGAQVGADRALIARGVPYLACPNGRLDGHAPATRLDMGVTCGWLLQHAFRHDPGSYRLVAQDLGAYPWAHHPLKLVEKAVIIRARDPFVPGEFALRDQLAASMSRLLDRAGDPWDQKGVALFDVPRGHWSYPYVSHVVNTGVMSPLMRTRFMGERRITRAFLAETVGRFFERLEQVGWR